MSPNHGCLAVGWGAICLGIWGPHHADIRARLFSHPRWQAHCLAQGDLEAFVGGPIRGRLHEDGGRRVDTGQGYFPPVSLPWWLFAGVLSITHCRRPFWLCRRVEVEASIGPQMSIPALDTLFSMSPGTPHYAPKTPEEAIQAYASLDACCAHWTV